MRITDFLFVAVRACVQEQCTDQFVPNDTNLDPSDTESGDMHLRGYWGLLWLFGLQGCLILG
jgi:hypothetical protein